MATTIGRVEYLVDLDGKTVPIQARKIGAQIGQSMGKSADSEFQKALNTYGKQWASRMSKSGKLAGVSFGDALQDSLRSKFDGLTRDMADVFSSRDGIDEFVKNFEGDASEAVKTLQGNLEKLRREVIAYVDESGQIQTRNVLNGSSYDALTRQLKSYSTALNKAADEDLAKMISEGMEWDKELRAENATIGEQKGRLESLRTEIAKLSDGRRQDNVLLAEQMRIGEAWTKEINDSNDALDKNSAAHDRNRKSVDGHSSAWKSLSANTRQWILIGSAIAAAAAPIAVLGSTAGSSITVLAGALSELVIVGGVAVAGFSLLSKDLSDLSGNAATAKEALTGFTDSFSKLRDIIGEHVLAGADVAFNTLSATIAALQGPLLLVADSVSRFFSSFAASVAEGTTGFANWSALITASASFFDQFGSSLIQFGTALGTIFVAAIPSIQTFGIFLNDIATRFSAWLSGDVGQAALTGFFTTLNTLAGPLVDLIAAAGQAIADLVTPATIASTVALLENLTEFMPALSGILAVLGNLDVFGLLAELLNGIGTAITPILPQLMTFATILSGFISTAIQALVPVVSTLLASFMPLLPVIVQLVDVILDALLPILPPLAALLAQVGPIVAILAGALITALVPALTTLSDLFVQLLPILSPILELIGTLAPVVAALGDVISQVLAVAVGVILAILPSLVDIFMALWSVIEPLIPIIVQVIDAGLTPMLLAVNLLIPVLQLIATVIAAVIQVIAAIIKPISDAIGSFTGLKDGVAEAKRVFSDWGDSVKKVIDGVIGAIKGAIGWFTDLFGAQSKANSGGGKGSSGGGGGFASGGVVAGAAYRLTGEAGPEAIVPLNRNLADVDPSVRALSAIAQGLSYSGTAAGPGKSVTVAQGAVQIVGVQDPTAAGTAAIDRLITLI